jgi:hypothetical protein
MKILNNIDEKVDVYVYLADRLSYTMATGYSSESLVFMTNVSNFFGMPNTFCHSGLISILIKIIYLALAQTILIEIY